MKAYVKGLLLAGVIFVMHINCVFASESQLNDTYGAYGLYQNEDKIIQSLGKQYMITKPEYSESQDCYMSQFYSLDWPPHRMKTYILYFANNTGYVNELRVITMEKDVLSKDYEAFLLSAAFLGDILMANTKAEKENLQIAIKRAMREGDALFWSNSNQRMYKILYMKTANETASFTSFIYEVQK